MLSKPNKTRDRLLEVASELFYTQGIQNVGINDVIRTADVARMSLYNHFTSKDELVLAVLEQRSEERQLRWREVESRTTNPTKRLLMIFDVLEEIMHEPDYRGCAFINATVEMADPHHPVQQRSIEHKEATRTYLKQLAMQANLEHAESLSWQLITLMDGAIATVLVRNDPNLIVHAKRAAQALIKAHTRKGANRV